MIKNFHIFLALLSFSGFIYRVFLLQINPHVLREKWLKIMPHAVDTLLLLTGLTLFVQGSWIGADTNWLIAKIIALLGYIGLAMVVMRSRTHLRWYALAGVLICFFYILAVAISKNPLVFI